MKKLISVFLSICLFFLCSACQVKYYDEEFSELLASCLLERNRIANTYLEDTYELDFKCVEAEREELKYDGKRFKNPRFQAYIDGLKKQVEALEKLDFNSDAYNRLWNQGYMERFENMFQLVEEEELIVPKEYRFEIAREFLEQEVIHQIIQDYVKGTIAYDYDTKQHSYCIDVSIENKSNLELKDIILNVSFNTETHSIAKKSWKPKEKWDARIYVSREVKNRSNTVDCNFVKATCFGDLTYDKTSEIETYFE